MSATAGVNAELIKLIDFLKRLPADLQAKAVERISPIADELDEEWWDIQFANTPPEVFAAWRLRSMRISPRGASTRSRRSAQPPKEKGNELPHAGSLLEALRRPAADVQEEARRAYGLFRRDPFDPRLQFKQLGGRKGLWSARIGRNWRVLGRRVDNDIY